VYISNIVSYKGVGPQLHFIKVQSALIKTPLRPVFVDDPGIKMSLKNLTFSALH
jgi:hypothetical protein